jgi:dual-specificity kinase
MSTPTTAKATLAHYNPHHYPYSHHHHQSYQANGASPYLSTAPASQILPTSSTTRNPHSLSTTANSYSTNWGYSASSNSHNVSSSTSTNGIISNVANSPAATTTSQYDYGYTASTGRREAELSTMPISTQQHSVTDAQAPARKRRRSRGPNWDDFYRNGLPQEIIVIDDSPEPSQTATNDSSQRKLNGDAATTVSTAHSARHVPKKRKRDDDHSQYDPVYHSQYAGSNTNTPNQHATPSGSTISTGRTNSAITTTAATSLSSSNGHYEPDVHIGQKRKRTRQQVANEAKKKEVEALGDAYTSYKPPPLPHKKAQPVHVRVVHDVS